jgi:hypothetical protein
MEARHTTLQAPHHAARGRRHLAPLLACTFLSLAAAPGAAAAEPVAARGPAPPLGPPTARPESGAAGQQSGPLRDLGARLRMVQRHLARVRRRLATGGEPPRRTLRRLRRSLEEVTPLLEERLSGDPRLRRVRRRLGRARASADAVIVAIRSSERRGPEIGRLLPWLIRFRGPVALLAPQPATTEPDRLTPARTLSPAAYKQTGAP